MSAIQVRWLPPEDPNGGIIKYNIEYQPVGQGSPHSWVDTDDGNMTTKDVTALNGSTLYQFRVRAVSKVPGDWSKFVQVLTQGDGELISCHKHPTLPKQELMLHSIYLYYLKTFFISSSAKRSTEFNPNHPGRGSAAYW